MNRQMLDGYRVFVIERFLGREMCEHLIQRSEALGYPRTSGAPLTVADAHLAETLWERARALIPRPLGAWEVVGFDEHLRFYRAEPGSCRVTDARVHGPNGTEARLTFVVYLNAQFYGGETVFHGPNRVLRHSVRPVRGKALIFAPGQAHENLPVDSGRQYVLRLDVLYRRLDAAPVFPTATGSGILPAAAVG
jgi:hypothetical protein